MPPEGTYDPTRTLLVTAADVRALTGYTNDRDISDADLQSLIRDAQAGIIAELAPEDQVALDGPIDGSNTRFMVPSERPSRIIVDDTLNQTTDGSDVVVQLRNDNTDPPTFTTATVSSIDALNAILTLSAAPATTISKVLLTARLVKHRVDREKLKACIKYLVAHLVTKRQQQPGRVNLANPQAQDPDAQAHAGRGYWTIYRAELKTLKKARPRLVGTDTRLPAGESIPEVRTSP